MANQQLLHFFGLNLPSDNSASSKGIGSQTTTEEILSNIAKGKEKVYNVGYLNLSWLSDTSGEIEYSKSFKCQNNDCGAFFNKLSEQKDGNWKCEFCGKNNQVKDASQPKGYAVIMNLEKVVETKPRNTEMALILCIDMSIEENLLSNVRSAVTSIISKLMQENKNTKVGLVLFSDEVIIYGDCANDQILEITKETEDIKKNRLLKSADSLYTHIVKNCKTWLSYSIANSKENILKILSSIKHKDKSTLGLGIIASRALIRGYMRGSQIIAFTNAKTNLWNNIDENEKMGTSSTIAGIFKDESFPISCFAVKSDGDDLKYFKKMIEQSVGVIRQYDPSKFPIEVPFKLSSCIARNIEIKIITPKGLIDHITPVQNNNFRLPEIKRGDCFFFEYQIEKPSEKPIPIQVHITYTKGSQRKIRVITDIIQRKPLEDLIIYPKYAAQLVESNYEKDSSFRKEVFDKIDLIRMHISGVQKIGQPKKKNQIRDQCEEKMNGLHSAFEFGDVNEIVSEIYNCIA